MVMMGRYERNSGSGESMNVRTLGSMKAGAGAETRAEAGAEERAEKSGSGEEWEHITSYRTGEVNYRWLRAERMRSTCRVGEL